MGLIGYARDKVHKMKMLHAKVKTRNLEQRAKYAKELNEHYSKHKAAYKEIDKNKELADETSSIKRGATGLRSRLEAMQKKAQKRKPVNMFESTNKDMFGPSKSGDPFGGGKNNWL